MIQRNNLEYQERIQQIIDDINKGVSFDDFSSNRIFLYNKAMLFRLC